MTPAKSAKNPDDFERRLENGPYSKELLMAFYVLMYKKAHIKTEAITRHLLTISTEFRNKQDWERSIKKMKHFFFVELHQPIAKHPKGGYFWCEDAAYWKRQAEFGEKKITAGAQYKKAAMVNLNRFANNELKGLSV